MEELVIAYLQIKENYYVLSNSIANRSTTVLIECEMISRDINNPRKAVVQVKAKPKIAPDDYNIFIKKGYKVYFYDGGIVRNGSEYTYIRKDELIDFYNEYKTILPNSITQWEKLFV